MKLDIYKNTKVLVTGSTGFKGSWLAFWLHKLGANVVGIGLKPEKHSFIFKSLTLNQFIKQYYMNITNKKKLNEVVSKEKPDIIFHLAAQSIVSQSVIDPVETFESNVMGSVNILQIFKENNINSLVFCSSDKCYKNNEWIWGYRETDLLGGKDPYSASKSAAEIIFNSFCKTYFINNKFNALGSVRAGNVIGGGDFKKHRIIPDIIKSITNKKNLTLRNPKSTRPWQHVLDPLYGYLLLGEALLKRKINVEIPSWNFGPNIDKTSYTVEYLASNLIKRWGTNTKIITLKNKDLDEAGLLLLNNEKAKIELGWTPRLSLDDTIQFTYEWYFEYFNKKSNVIDLTNRQINSFLTK